jgi:catechol 2,3-dioxygenase-like lactoylglutathione lyase family enzyme
MPLVWFANQGAAMIRALDHLVILVNDLDAAAADYARLGFTVVTGGEHADGASHNNLISFADGAYLELIAFKREAPGHMWWRHTATGEGLIDFALLPSSTPEVVAEARARGLELIGPRDGGRLRPDGVRLAWQTAMAVTDDLPFLCGDVTPRDLRVPHGAAHTHPNHAQGIAAVHVAVRDLDASARRYSQLLGTEPMLIDDRPTFPLGAATIVLRSPAADPEAAALAAHIAAREEGIFAAVISGVNALDPQLLHGARLLPVTA